MSLRGIGYAKAFRPGLLPGETGWQVVETFRSPTQCMRALNELLELARPQRARVAVWTRRGLFQVERLGTDEAICLLPWVPGQPRDVREHVRFTFWSEALYCPLPRPVASEPYNFETAEQLDDSRRP